MAPITTLTRRAYAWALTFVLTFVHAFVLTFVRTLVRNPTLALLACVLVPLQAQAELMLNPTRVVFTNNQRAAQVELINNGSEPATYRINLVNRRMTETGEFESAPTALENERFADGMLHYSPRQITLQPGTAQVVRVMVRKPEVLAEGEYRSHLHFEKLPNPRGMNSVDGAGRQDKQIGVVVNTLIGTSIPVIVRHGTLGATLALTGLTFKAGAGADDPMLAFQIERSGTSSVYGDIEARFTPAGRAEHVVAKVAGVAVYTPNATRRAAVPLRPPAGVTLARGTLRLIYRERAEAGGKIMAEATTTLP